MRTKSMTDKMVTITFTGPPGSGKTTMAEFFYRKLQDEAVNVILHETEPVSLTVFLPKRALFRLQRNRL